MKKIVDFVALFIAQLGIAGLSPKAPGTMGSLLALILAPWLFLPFAFHLQMAVLLAVFVFGGVVGSRAEKVCACKDPSEVVIDELLGQWIALLPLAAFSADLGAAPQEFLSSYWPWLLLAFGLFRFFDILKPWPIKQSENWLPAGFGIMLDDLIAGLFAALVLQLILFFCYSLGFNVAF